MDTKKNSQRNSKKIFNFHDDDWLFSLLATELKKHEIDINKSEKVFNEIPVKIEKLSDQVSRILLKDLKKRKDEMVFEHFLIDQGFNLRIYQRYQEPFSLMQMLYVVITESIMEFNEECNKLFINNNQYLYRSILLIHARCCQIFAEIFSLLKNGYPEGAMARWRSLYELVVISYYLIGEGDEIAKKYLDHIIIENYKLMESHNKAIKEGFLKEKPLTIKDFKKLTLKKDSLLRIYGKNFYDDYGWSKEKNFRDIQNSVKINQLKPYYKWSNSFIHSGSKGTIQKLGLIDISNKKQTLVLGPSNYGFSEPGNLATISLFQVSTIAFSLNPTIYCNCVMKILDKLVEEIGSSLYKVQKQILKEEGF